MRAILCGGLLGGIAQFRLFGMQFYWRFFQKAAGIVVQLKQSLDPSAKLRIVSACLVEELSARLG